jgi:adenosylcobinamide kinase/adenosylcobinamide-phosphate guanylyltransferase
LKEPEDGSTHLGEIILITGGRRSGKSEYARRAAEALPGRRVFVATCPVVDAELADRVRAHRLEREAAGWHTREEEIELADALREAVDFRVALVDCLTLWVNNLVYRAVQEHRTVTERDMEHRCRELIAVCREQTATVILVTNEVGMGIVPENALSRLYCDLLGRCNQVMASSADRVVFMTCGLSIVVKGGGGVCHSLANCSR